MTSILSAFLECVGLSDPTPDPSEVDTLLGDLGPPSTQQDSASVDTCKGSVKTLDTRLSDAQTLCESLVNSATRMKVKGNIEIHEPVVVKAGERMTCMGMRAITYYREVAVHGWLKIQDHVTFRWGLEVDGVGVVAVGNYAFIRGAIVKDRGIITVAGKAVFDESALTVRNNGHILLLGNGLPRDVLGRPFSSRPAGIFQCNVDVQDYGVIEIHGDALFRYGVKVGNHGKIIVHGDAKFCGTVEGAHSHSIVVKRHGDSEYDSPRGLTVEGKFKRGLQQKKPCHCNDRWP